MPIYQSARRHIPGVSNLQELDNVCFSPDIITGTLLRDVRWAKHVAFTEDVRNSHASLIRSHGNKRQRERPKYVCQVKIKFLHFIKNHPMKTYGGVEV
jgi:hypothetical protein